MIDHEDIWVLLFFIVLGIIFSSINNTDLNPYSTSVITFKEVKDLRCDGIIALGCTTPLGGNAFLIEYVPDSQRCNKSFCISKNQTIQHELNHVTQYAQTGRFWEVENT